MLAQLHDKSMTTANPLASISDEDFHASLSSEDFVGPWDLMMQDDDDPLAIPGRRATIQVVDKEAERFASKMVEPKASKERSSRRSSSSVSPKSMAGGGKPDRTNPFRVLLWSIYSKHPLKPIGDARPAGGCHTEVLWVYNLAYSGFNSQPLRMICKYSIYSMCHSDRQLVLYPRFEKNELSGRTVVR